jgi:hypothetical protein
MSLTSTSNHVLTPRADSYVAAVATTNPGASSKPRMLLGSTMGLLAAVIGSLYSVYATYGLAANVADPPRAD